LSEPVRHASWRCRLGQQRGAVAVEYALSMVIVTIMLGGVLSVLFEPMAIDILKDFMRVVAKPYP